MTPLARLRLRLMAWYVGTFGLIIVLLSGALFYAIQKRVSGGLDARLKEATTQFIHVAKVQATKTVPITDAVQELFTPDRPIYLLTTEGVPIKPETADPWIRLAAQRAGTLGQVDRRFESRKDHTLRLHAERFAVGLGQVYVVAAVVDQFDLEDQYASLIREFTAGTLVAMLLVVLGGYKLAQKSAAPIERATENMRRFMADAAHELRTPVAVLRSLAETTLQRPRELSDYGRVLERVEREAERLGGIVGNLLMLSRADADQLVLQRERIYLDDITSDTAEAVRPLAQQRGVSIGIDRFEEAAVMGDPVLVRQLVMIVLDNALKFTPAGGRVALDVSASGGRPTVVIKDNGVGISPEHLPHIFERFYRADSARATEGAGLGLSIARWIADAHAAQIDVTSIAGEGTSVALRFPPVLSQS